MACSGDPPLAGHKGGSLSRAAGGEGCGLRGGREPVAGRRPQGGLWSQKSQERQRLVLPGRPRGRSAQRKPTSSVASPRLEFPATLRHLGIDGTLPAARSPLTG